MAQPIYPFARPKPGMTRPSPTQTRTAPQPGLDPDPTQIRILHRSRSRSFFFPIQPARCSFSKSGGALPPLPLRPPTATFATACRRCCHHRRPPSSPASTITAPFSLSFGRFFCRLSPLLQFCQHNRRLLRRCSRHRFWISSIQPPSPLTRDCPSIFPKSQPSTPPFLFLSRPTVPPTRSLPLTVNRLLKSIRPPPYPSFLSRSLSTTVGNRPQPPLLLLTASTQIHDHRRLSLLPSFDLCLPFLFSLSLSLSQIPFYFSLSQTTATELPL